MKKFILALVITLAPAVVLAAGGGAPLLPANIDIDDKESLQRGAKAFTDYCLSCHGAKFVRFNRVAEDLGLTEEQVMTNLNHLGVKFGDTMQASMTKKYAKAAFGAAPPDLSLVARSRGVDWLYTYLTGFYVDPNRPMGFNNVVFKDVGMPNVFWRIQGNQEPLKEKNEKGEMHVVGVKPATGGSMSNEEFDQMARDLVAFMDYMGEPRKSERKSLGIWVILFLIFFAGVAYALKKEYWKDVH